MARIEIYCGNYGSGKTEIALERAFSLDPPPTLVDLDIVNPYFRSSEHRSELEAHGVTVYAPTFAGTTLDIPSLPAELYAVFADKHAHVLFDVGGDPTGAAALGRFFPYFQADDARMYFVVNIRRPFTETAEAIADLASMITARARIPVSALINNTNLQDETTPLDVQEGQRVAVEAARLLGVPVSAIYAMPHVIDELPADFRASYGALLHPLTRRMRPEFI